MYAFKNLCNMRPLGTGDQDRVALSISLIQAQMSPGPEHRDVVNDDRFRYTITILIVVIAQVKNLNAPAFYTPHA